MKLTDCNNYEAIVSELKARELSSSELSTMIIHYLKTYHFYKATGNDDSHRTYKQVYDWLCKYKDNNNKGQKVLSCKKEAVMLLSEGKSIVDVRKVLTEKGYTISRTTLYKYKKSIVNGI